MAAKGLRERYADRWFAYVEIVAQGLDERRAGFVRHYPEMEHTRSASAEVDLARLALEKLLAAVAGRMTHFRTTRVQRHGPLWDGLHRQYLAGCAEVQAVYTTLSLSIAVLLNDDDSLPPTVLSGNTARMTMEQRSYWQEVEPQLEGKTRRFLAQARSMFVEGRRLAVSSAAASQVSRTD